MGEGGREEGGREGGREEGKGREGGFLMFAIQYLNIKMVGSVAF